MGSEEHNRNQRYKKEPTMENEFNEGPVQRPLPDYLKFHQVIINLAKGYLGLEVSDRQNVMHALEQFAFGEAKTASYWDVWSKDDVERCYLQLQPISQEMANDFRYWAAAVLSVGRNNKLALKCLMDELVIRTWIDEP
jgi:hypothetical protein